MAESNTKENMDIDRGNGAGDKLDTVTQATTELEQPPSHTTKNGKMVVMDDEARQKRQIKKGDSGISVEKSENSSDEEDVSKKLKVGNSKPEEGNSVQDESVVETASFPKLKSKAKTRNYRSKKRERNISDVSSDEEAAATSKDSHSPKPAEGRSSPDSGHQECSSALEDVDMEDISNADAEVEETSGPEGDHNDGNLSDNSRNSNDSNYSDFQKTTNETDSEKKIPDVFTKQKPKHKWFVMQEVVNRQKGLTSRKQGAELFQQRCYGSLHSVQRLELMYKLEQHVGCVNALHFNTSGSLLASGSDDLKIVVWDWPLGKSIVTYDSGHRSNVFQAKFMPFTGDTHIVSCARDGQIRLAELSSTGVCRSTRRLATHHGPAHKIAIQADTPHVFLSSAEDGLVMCVDLRDAKPNKLLFVKEGDRKVPLYSIHANPLNCNEFCVSGRDNYIRIYDKRRAVRSECIKKLCPRHLENSCCIVHVTCAMFNHNGTEILGSYNDEDIYLFDRNTADEADFIHRYEGHRNNATVKGVNFFGPKSEFIVSGSDCGNIYFWDKETEAIVQWMPGDENGVVNCLEPHPQMPVIATSGLDDDVKIWVPSCEQEPSMDGLKPTVAANVKGREDDRLRDPDSQMLWLLWRQIRRAERRRARDAQTTGAPRSPGFNPQPTRAVDQDSTSSDDNNSSDSEDGLNPVQCSPS